MLGESRFVAIFNYCSASTIHGFQITNEVCPCSFLGITANEEYGGLGMGYQAHCVVMEEISRASGKEYPIPSQKSYIFESESNSVTLTRKHWSLLRRPFSTLCQSALAERLTGTKGTVLAGSAFW